MTKKNEKEHDRTTRKKQMHHEKQQKSSKKKIRKQKEYEEATGIRTKDNIPNSKQRRKMATSLKKTLARQAKC
jgi:hypothetical protein